MNTSVFLISKPLQYFNASNIGDKNKKWLIVINCFANADIFVKNIRLKSDYWEQVYFFNNYVQAFEWLILNKLAYENLYIDGDCSLERFKYLFKLKSKKIFVIEEGLSAYIKDLRRVNLFYLKKETFSNIIKCRFLDLIYSLLGNENYEGGSKYTTGIFVYDHERRRNVIPNYKKEIGKFNKSFISHLRSHNDRDILYKKDENFIALTKGKNVLIYLSSWSIISDIEKHLVKYKDYIKVLKPHPHILNNDLKAYSCFDYIVNSQDMVEFMIIDLLDNAQHITVLHHGSSALQYFDKEKNIKSIII